MRETSEYIHCGFVQRNGVVTQLDVQIVLLTKISSFFQVLLHLFIIFAIGRFKIESNFLWRVLSFEKVLSIYPRTFSSESQVN